MIQENIAELVGTLKFKVDARPLVAFEKKLEKVTTMLQQFGEAANKKFNIKVSLDSRTLRAQLDKATNAKIAFKNFSINEEALMIASKKICEVLDKTPIRLANIKVDVSELVAQKRFIRTLLGQMQINLPMTIKFKQADAMLREWKKKTEEKFTLRVKADIAQAAFLANVRRSLKAVQDKIGVMEVKVTDPKLKLKVDQADLRAQLNAVISSREYTVRLKVRRGGEEEGQRRTRVRDDHMPHRRERSDAFGGGIAGASMGFMRGAIPGLGAAFAFSQLNQINQQMQAQQNAMTAVMGSEQKGQEQSEWVKNLSNTIGMDYRQVAPSYNKMLASGQTSGLSTENVQNIFQGVSEYGRTMGLDSESMKGSMRAIEQMMNKGQVMSEELKGQLAERMPGAISAMAEAAEFTGPDAVAKLFKAMENGEIKSNAVLEKFSKILAERARQGGALEKAMESTAAQQARMNNAFSDTVAVFSAAGFDAGMGKFFRAMADAMVKAEPGIKSLGQAFELLINPINAIINVGASLLTLLPKLGAAFGMSGGEMSAILITAGLFSTTIGAAAASIGILALAIDDLIVYSEGGDSLFGDWINSTPDAQQGIEKLGNAIDNLIVTLDGIPAKFGLITDSVGTLSTAITGLSFSSSFLSAMDKLASLVNALGNGIESAGSLFSGDTEGAMDSLERMKSNIGDYMTSSLQDVMGSLMRMQVDRMIANRTPEEQREAFSRETAPTVTIGPTTVQVMIDPSKTPDMTTFMLDVQSAMRDQMEGVAKAAFKDSVSDLFTGTKELK
jgi:tape measure domain-containing protein